MLTYKFEKVEGPLYEYIYQCIKADIIAGNLQPGEKLPSKRTFANNNGISTITIQNAYDQLISEGYIETIPKKGYYVARLEGMTKVQKETSTIDNHPGWEWSLRRLKEEGFIEDYLNVPWIGYGEKHGFGLACEYCIMTISMQVLPVKNRILQTFSCTKTRKKDSDMNETVTKRFLLYFRLMLLVWILIANAIIHVTAKQLSVPI